MATRRRSTNKTITGTVLDLQGRVKTLSSQSTPSKLSNNVVETRHIRPKAIGVNEIADNAVTGTSVAESAIDTIHVSNESITEDKIANGSITLPKLESSLAASLVREFAVEFVTSTVNRMQVVESTASGGGKKLTLRVRIEDDPNNLQDAEFLVSSLRYKTDVENYSISDAKKILELSLKKFKYSEEKKNLHDQTNREWFYGYIAEELQESGIEEVLSYDDSGAPEKVNYALLSLRVIELLKVQQQEIDLLKQETDLLKEEVQRLKDRNNV